VDRGRERITQRVPTRPIGLPTEANSYSRPPRALSWRFLAIGELGGGQTGGEHGRRARWPAFGGFLGVCLPSGAGERPCAREIKYMRR
jgi:hypothetical protein